ncbi:acyl-CoA N-acyltransferase [Coprinopsis sp. MPI-PUGE-AT-0042]|nr:acyl-CoA N-acyltransferase [Coprinopsis sp. MPI-PUGE-AT-0042]
MIGTPYQGLGPPSSPASPETYFWICIMISSKQSGFRRPRISEPSSSYNLHLPNTSSTIIKVDRHFWYYHPGPATAFPLADATTSVLIAEELASVTELLAAAYSDDPFTQVATANDVDFYGQMHAATVVAGSLGGEVYLAETKDNKKIIGVAVWFGPGREMFDSPDQQEQALGPLMGHFKPELRAWWGEEFLPTYAKFNEDRIGAGVKKNNWHLQTLATHPDYQRQGVARALIETVVRKASQMGHLICLETQTETNVGIYGRLGFKVAGEPIEITGLTGSFPFWVLIRKTN